MNRTWREDRISLAMRILILCLAFGRPALAADPAWTQFRGPDGQGHSELSTLPRVWDKTNGIAWKTKIPGLGHSSPVHDGKTIWLTTAVEKGSSLQAVAVDAHSGEILRTVTLFQPEQVEEIHPLNSYASPTPVLQGDRLYVHFGTYGTACLNAQSGEVLWKNSGFPVKHDGGPGSSPVLFEDLLMITLDGADTQRVVALECETGKMRWTRTRSIPFPPNQIECRAFCTPLLIEHGNRKMLISPGAQQCQAYNPLTGDDLWVVRFSGFSTVPRPVYNGTHCFICTGYFKPELWAIDPSGTGDVTNTHVKWKFKGEVSETPSPIVVGESIYLVSNKGILTVLHAGTGKRQGLLRLGGNYSASPFHANGQIYCCNEEGMVKLVDSQLAKPRVVTTNRMEERIMASPAVIGNDLLIRTDAALYRISGSLSKTSAPAASDLSEDQ